MKYLSFNSKKSVEQEKLIFDEPFLLMVLENFHRFILIIAPIIFGAAFFYVQLNFQNPVLLPFSAITLFLSLFFCFFIFRQIKKANKFRIIKGSEDRRENIESVERICNKNNWEILHTDNHSQVIKIENHKIAYHSGRELYLVYQDNKIYLRCLTYSMHDLINPFHWDKQSEIENMIIENFQ